MGPDFRRNERTTFGEEEENMPGEYRRLWSVFPRLLANQNTFRAVQSWEKE